MLGEHYRSVGRNLRERRDEGVMGRQRAEESLNSFNAAPPLSDARLGHLGAVSSQQEVKDHTFLKTGWAADPGVPPSQI